MCLFVETLHPWSCYLCFWFVVVMNYYFLLKDINNFILNRLNTMCIFIITMLISFLHLWIVKIDACLRFLLFFCRFSIIIHSLKLHKPFELSKKYYSRYLIILIMFSFSFIVERRNILQPFSKTYFSLYLIICKSDHRGIMSPCI